MTPHTARPRLALLLVTLLAGPPGWTSEIVLRPLPSGAFTNLVRNGAFADTHASGFVAWTAAADGYRVGAGEGRLNSAALACQAASPGGWSGALRLDTAVGGSASAVATELLRGTVLPRTEGGWRVEVPAGGAAAVRLAPLALAPGPAND